MDISLYQDPESLNAEVLNRPLIQLITELENLKTQVELISSGSNTYTLNVPYDEDSNVALGKLVYIGSDGLVRPAKAIWKASADRNGIILADDSAYVAGFVSAINTGAKTATIITRGSIPSTVVSQYAGTLFNSVSGPWTGTWYLSPEVPGTVMRDADDLYMKIPVVKVDSIGNLYLTGAQPFTGYHIHKAFTIPVGSTWTNGANGYTYSGTAINDLVFFNWTDATIFIDGAIDYSHIITLSESGSSVVVSSSQDMTNHTVGIYIAIPDAHAQPVVRGIRSIGSSRLTLSSTNGLVEIGIDGWNGQEPEPGYRDRAVSTLLENGGYAMTKVVSHLTSDETISVTEGANGEWAITSNGGSYIRPTVVQSNNSTTTALDNVLYYVFPYSRTSSFTGTIHIPAPPTGWHWIAYPFAMAAQGALDVDASLMWAANSTPGTETSIPSAASPASINIAATVSTGRMNVVADDGWELSSGGDAWLTLEADGSSAADMRMLSFGIYLEAEQNA